MDTFINSCYIIASILFVIGLKKLSSQQTARRGNKISSCGMLLAIIATLIKSDIVAYHWIAIGLVGGAAIGWIFAQKVQMTSMPEMVALFNGFGGIASLLVGWAEYHARPDSGLFTLGAISVAVIIGGITFTGSLIAYAKLSEKLDGKPILFKGQLWLNGTVLAGLVIASGAFCRNAPELSPVFLGIIIVSFLSGVLLTIPIGGADMPVVIALLNSYSGLAACAAGFAIMNNVLIVAGSLVGASGLILTHIMCKAMNRSLSNVMFAGVGSTRSEKSGYQGEAKPISARDTYLMLEAANSVIFVPGYGMAVAQAQHVVQELATLLEANGTEVKFAIHPVAGRMPGHMNVLLAEANVPYELLVEPDDVNPTMPTVDVSMVIGANDVVNPAARTDKQSALYGMPIIDVDKARTCVVLKRSLRPGFAGVDNPLFFGDNTRMLFGDAKATLSEVVAEFKG